jgi:hypothetical protein
MSSARVRRQKSPPYRERLRVPVRWWALGTLLVGSFWLAMLVAVPEQITWSISAILLALLAILLRTYGSAKIVVTDAWLHAGRARIQRTFLGTVEPLDAPQMRSQAGPKASARAYLLLRPYISTGVRVTINDPHDPTPYWLLSTRHPAALAAALATAQQHSSVMLGPDHAASSSPDGRPAPDPRREP